MAADTVKKDHVFNTAAEITDPTEQAKYLDEACGGDTQFRAEIEDLLRHDVAAGSFLEEPIVGERPTEVLNALTDRDGVPVPTPSEISLDFLKPCGVPDRLGMLGPYEVIEVIGKGGMGVVLRAHDPKLNRVVAVKALAPEFAANPTARKRFLREAQAAAAVSHPHVVSIYAVDEDENTPYLVMECIDGQSLQDKINRVGHLEIKEILRIGSQIASGLAAAHSQGLIHRDVKPGNILLENGVERVKITDFGLARAVDDVGVTRTGDVAGTPLYMSPEQAQAKPLDHRSDLFSLGCVLYAMCTGRSPFRAETTVAVLRRVCDDTPRPIREIHAEIPETLVAIIERLLAKDPDERFQTAEEVADVLGQHLAYLQYPTQTPPPALMEVAKGTSAQPEPRKYDSKADKASPSRTGVSRQRFWVSAAVILLVLVGSLSITEATGVTRLAATVIRIATGEGTLVIEVDDPTVKVSIDGEDVSISGAGVEELRLRPGQYRFKASKDGKPVKEELVTISRGGREVVKVTMELPGPSGAVSQAKTPPKPWQELWPGAPPPAVAPFDAKKARQHQEAWAKHLGGPVEYTNSIGMKFRLIPPGEFMMGSTKLERQLALEDARATNDQASIKRIDTEGPQHQVRITKPFYLGVYEVTQGEYEHVVEMNPSHFSHLPRMDTSRFPVEMITWRDAANFCQCLSSMPAEKLAGHAYRLPTEAEWEYACRAGTATPFHFGNQLDGREANCRGILPYGTVEEGPNLGRTTTVGSYQPNAFGLYDMHGNVKEWCQDWYRANYYSDSAIEDPAGPEKGLERVYRSRGWGDLPGTCRSAYRGCISPDFGGRSQGFRLTLASSDDLQRTPKFKLSAEEPKSLKHEKPHVAGPQPGAWPPAVEPIDSQQARQHQKSIDKLRTLVTERPDEPKHHRDLAYALVARGRDQCRLDDLREAIAILRMLPVDDPDLSAGSKGVSPRQALASAVSFHALLQMRHMGHVDEAIAGTTESIRINPEWAEGYSFRSEAFLIKGETDKCLADCSRAIELAPDEPDLWFYLAIAQLACEDAQGYRKGCTRMLARFGQTGDYVAAYRTAFACALAPDALIDFSEAIALARFAVEKGPVTCEENSVDLKRRLRVLGAILYRAGKLDEASQQLANEKSDFLYLLAMAYHDQGNDEEAKRQLDRAVDWTYRTHIRDVNFAVARGMGWWHLIVKLWREEAEALILKDEE